MTPVIELADKNAGPDAPVKLYACGKCGTCYSVKMTNTATALEEATACCTPRKCSQCEKPTKGFMLRCSLCEGERIHANEEKHLARATKYTVEQAPDGPLFYDDDRFATHIDELLDTLAADDASDDKFPLVAWVCKVEAPAVDFDDLVEWLTETLDLADDFSLSEACVDLEELKTFIAAWNAKQKPSIWVPHYNEYIWIEKTDLPE